MLSLNPSIFELDYDVMEKRSSLYKWELLEVAMHPSRIERYLNQGIEIGKLNDYF
jgi:hypothetical protein